MKRENVKLRITLHVSRLMPHASRIMRILYFSRDYTTHDHRFLSALAKTEHAVGSLRLERRGHQVEDRPLPPEIKQIQWAGGQSTAEFSDGPRLVAGLRRVIGTFEPDLIQAGPLQRSAFLVALTGFHPLVSMSWGYDLLMDADRNRWWNWATRYTLRRSDAFVGDCDTIRNLAIQHGMTPDRIVTFPWGANLQRFTPLTPGSLPAPLSPLSALRTRLGWGDDTFVLLSTRGWSDIYGVEDLARAFVCATRQRPELRLLMLGNGPLASTIRRIFIRGGVQDQVHFPGQVTQENLPNFYRAADLYISTSHSDGTSISLLEALACGTPVLLADIPGNQEWIRGEGVGWLFRDGEVDSLTEGILHAWGAREQLPAMGRAARHLAESRANWEKNFLKLFEAWEIALS
ncbi:MAG: glycosyltransferase family 4 protein [Chloroflexi bacterium]|nr:glycosyltransferase family 4 protein [Chloroflexota bacterium]